MSAKAYVLYFESEDVAKLIKTKLEDGMIDTGDKLFNVGDRKPKMIRTMFGYYPLYALRWDSINPADDFNPTFKPDKDINPEILKKTMSLKVLGNMLKIKKAIGGIWMILVGLIFGAFLAYLILTIALK